MLTDNEKEILGYMVDMGVLRGQQRVEAGQNDEKAREFISEFISQIRDAIPMQLAGLENQRKHLVSGLQAMTRLKQLILENDI